MTDSIAKLSLAVVTLAVLAGAGMLGHRIRRPTGGILLSVAAVTAGIGLIGFLVVVWRHLTFPLQLECQELTILQHARRLADGLPLYPLPSADFVPLTFAPGLYWVLAPLLKILPTSLVVLRLPAIIATLGLLVVFYRVAYRVTRSWRWGALGALLPVLAMRSLDCALTKGHADALQIVAGLGGAFLLRDTRRHAGRGKPLLAALCPVLAFWLGQTAVLLVVGGGLFLLLRDRGYGAMPLLMAVLLGPVAFFLGGPAAFGDGFLESAYRLPLSSMQPGAAGLSRLAGFAANWWLVPAAVALGAWIDALRRKRLLHDPVIFLYPFALGTAILGAFDPVSSDDVFALAGVWALLAFLRAAGPWLTIRPVLARERLALAALVVTMAMLTHDFRDWIPARSAGDAHREFSALLRNLDGPVYAPWLGDLPPTGAGTPTTTARAHWVALDDRARAAVSPQVADDLVRELLAPVAAAPPPAYIITAAPLEEDRLLSWLAGRYTLDHAFGARFEALRELPSRFGSRFPRYLYRRLP